MKSAFIFDLDGTLIDSVYQHVIAWSEALDSEGLSPPVSRIHRKIGMSSELFAKQLLREVDGQVDADRITRVKKRQGEAFDRMNGQIKALPGARELLTVLTRADIPWAIATSGSPEATASNLEKLGLNTSGTMVLTGDDVEHGKPEPDLFLKAAERLGVPIERTYIVGDSIWDLLGARRCHALGLGLKSGGVGEEELQRAGALRVYEDPADLLDHLDELATLPK
ncbi:HAD family hydrolase [Caballeronia sordidicola]|uniref:HAD family hydrolase n=1 Tax=Caballeronia sordidicola TaxID=196367 RepID=UPI0004D01E7C|nr:HAD family hydrolase [Caballeronia sordidicola]